MYNARGELDTDRLTKLGVVGGLLLFAVGAVGELVGHAVYGTLPAWENALLFDAEVIGIAAVFFSVFVFGIFVPLTR